MEFLFSAHCSDNLKGYCSFLLYAHCGIDAVDGGDFQGGTNPLRPRSGQVRSMKCVNVWRCVCVCVSWASTGTTHRTKDLNTRIPWPVFLKKEDLSRVNKKTKVARVAC